MANLRPWQKGQSGNPAGRPKGIAATVREQTDPETLWRAERVLGEPSPRSEYWTLEESHRFTLAEILAGWVENDLSPDLGASFAADLLGYALSQVDWDEIADAWLESARESRV